MASRRPPTRPASWASALVTAVEISAIDDGKTDLHILGYGIDRRAIRLLAERLVEFRADRERRARRMADALRELGFELDDAVLSRRARAGQVDRSARTWPRPSSAHPANAERLAARGSDRDPSAFLVGVPDRGQARRSARDHARPSTEAIETIHDAGGVAVWAHPFWDVPEPGEVLDDDRSLPGRRARRRRVLLRHAHARADRARWSTAAPSSGC